MGKAKSPFLEILFPAAGVNRAAGFQSQPPYTTPYALNVRPFDPLATRQRGGSRPGVLKFDATKLGGGLPFQMLSYASIASSQQIATNMLLAVYNGAFYQNSSGLFAAVSGSINNSAKQIRGTQVGQKFYVADYRSVNLQDTNGTITHSGGSGRLNQSGYDWTTLNIDTAKDVLYLSGQVDLESNIFPITAVGSTYLTFSDAAAPISDQASGVTWQIGRIPKVFDPANPTTALKPLMDSLPVPPAHYATGLVTSVSGVVTLSGGDWSGVPQASDLTLLTLTIPNASGIGTQAYLVGNGSLQFTGGQWTLTLNDTTSDADSTNVAYTLSWTSNYYGIPPLNCTLCCTYRGRLVLAGPGSIWYMSRVLNANDWDYGYDPNDASRAVAGTSTVTGGIPDPITALIPHSDDYLIFASDRSLWMLTADPAYGGTITALSRDVGVLGPAAWCGLPDGSVVFLSRDGLYSIPPGQLSPPAPLSRVNLPAELLEVDYKNNVVSLCYDVFARGIHVSVTPNAGTAGTHYFVDMVNKGFWPAAYPNAMQPTAMLRYTSGPDAVSNVLYGCFDGYARNHSLAQTTDDGTAFTSVVAIGPVRMGGVGMEGVLTDLSATLDENSAPVVCGIYVSDSSQRVVSMMQAAATPLLSQRWTAGYNNLAYPGCRGNAIGMLLTGTAPWALEGIRTMQRMGGPSR